jgi:hypothetical protein
MDDDGPNSRIEGGGSANVGAGARPVLYNVITKFEMLAYVVATIAVVAFAHGSGCRTAANSCSFAAGFCRVGSLRFCRRFQPLNGSGMTCWISDTAWGAAYNSMGYTPLSVLSAFGLVISFSWRSIASTNHIRRGWLR